MHNVGGFCFAQLAASDNQKYVREETQRVESDSGYDAVAGYEDGETTASPTAAPGTFKDKLKGFVKNVKDGAADAYETVSDSVSGVAHDINEKGKKAVAGTKKLVSGAIDKIKSSFKKDDEPEVEVPRSSSAEHHQHANAEERSSEERHVHDSANTVATSPPADNSGVFLETEKKH